MLFGKKGNQSHVKGLVRSQFGTRVIQMNTEFDRWICTGSISSVSLSIFVVDRLSQGWGGPKKCQNGHF